MDSPEDAMVTGEMGEVSNGLLGPDDGLIQYYEKTWIWKSEHSLRNKLGRILWMVVYVLLFRTSPWCCHRWRRWLLRLFKAKVGKDVRVSRNARFWAPWNVELGAHSVVGPGTELYSVAPIVVEPYANIAQRCFLCTGSHDYRYLTRPLTSEAIRIERHAWLAAEVLIAPGVTVGRGSVCGARAAVFRDVPVWSVVGGNPARRIKNRQVIDPRYERKDP
jgi:putative colanic acid biosynthesis acetyltransferase WcaF